MNVLRLDVLAELERRRINATGALSASVDVNTALLPTETVGTMTALGYWKTAGSGTPPGGPVRVSDIQTWLDAKGLDFSAWAIARRIRRIGSKDFREGNPNAFLTAIETWETGPALEGLEELGANKYGDATVSLFNNLK